MRDWRTKLQSKGMRNFVLAMLALDAVGTYAAYVKLDQPLPADFGSELALEETTNADAEFYTLPSRPRPAQQVALAKMEPLPRAIPLPTIESVPDTVPAQVADDYAPAKRLSLDPRLARNDGPVRVALAAPAPRVNPAFAAAFANDLPLGGAEDGAAAVAPANITAAEFERDPRAPLSAAEAPVAAETQAPAAVAEPAPAVPHETPAAPAPDAELPPVQAGA